MLGIQKDIKNIKTIDKRSIRSILETTMSHPIHIELLKHTSIRAQLLEAFPDLDARTLLDTLEGTSDLTEMLSGIARAFLEDRSTVSALKQRLDDMRARLSRLETAAERKRGLIAEVMERAEIRKLSEPDFTLSLRDMPPGLQIINESEIPPGYWQPQPARLDRQTILASLMAGHSVPGAALSNGPRSISVRTR